MLRRWLDPPEVLARKRLLRAQPRGGTDLEIGCLWPLALMLGVAIAVGIVIGMQLSSPRTIAPAREAVVRVIDDSASPGPKVLATAIVSLP